MDHKFSGKVILVAGGTGGLGRSVSLAFLQHGATVHVTYRKPEELAALQREAAENAIALTGHVVDVTDEAATTALIDTILATNEQLDALVNTVGGYAGGTKLWEVETSVFEQQFALNLRAGYNLARAAIAPMLAQKSGAIVNIASQAALKHDSGAAAYAASKAAALAMVDSLAADVKGTGIRVNSILPSIFDTPANRKAMPNADFTSWPSPDDIAKVILFLCSEDSRVIHGAAIPVYGAK